MSSQLEQVTAPPRTVSVLHVDDDAAFRELTEDLLQREKENFDVVTVSSPSRALERIAETQVDCIVSDYDMPGMNGLEFLEVVRDRHPTLPFVLFTGKGSETVASEAFSAGATDYVQKSSGTSSYTVLANAVQNAVEKERARRKHQQHLRAIESAEEGIAILDGRSRFVFVNDRYAEIFGYEQPALTGEPIDLVQPEGSDTPLGERCLTAAQEQGYWHGQTTGLRRDGSTFPCETSVTATEADGVICVTRDLSEQRRREQELIRYQTIVETVADPVYTLDMEGRFTFVNEAMVEKLGYSREELLGEHASVAVTEESLERANAVIADLLEDDEQEKATVELEKTPADGSEFVGENHIALLTAPDGDVEGTAGVVRDITERKERAEELSRQRSLLEAQNERLDEFASLVSHDLQNPLGIAQTRLDLAAEACECGHGHHDDIERALTRMDAIVTDLLDLARQGGEVGDVATVALDDVARECWDRLQTDAAELRVAGEQTVRTDATLFQQLLENLLGNAAEHAGDAPTVTVGSLPDGFYVADDGRGIPEDERQRVFDAGYSMRDGTGFGLQVVQQVADAHGWDLTLTESTDGGARFEVTGVEVQEPRD